MTKLSPEELLAIRKAHESRIRAENSEFKRACRAMTMEGLIDALMMTIEDKRLVLMALRSIVEEGPTVSNLARAKALIDQVGRAYVEEPH